MELFQNLAWWAFIIIVAVLVRGYLGSLRSHEYWMLITDSCWKGKLVSSTIKDAKSLAWSSTRTILAGEIAMAMVFYFSPMSVSLVFMTVVGIVGLAWLLTEWYTVYQVWKRTKDK